MQRNYLFPQTFPIPFSWSLSPPAELLLPPLPKPGCGRSNRQGPAPDGQFFQYLMLKKIIPHNIAAELPYPRIEKKECHFLSLSDFEKLLTHLANQLQQKNGLRNLMLFLLLGIMGLRISSIRLLNKEDVDLTFGRLFVQEKAGSCRYIVLPQILTELLYAYLFQRVDSHKALLLSSRGKRLSQRAIQDIISQTAQACGITYHLHPHLFRPSGAVRVRFPTDRTLPAAPKRNSVLAILKSGSCRTPLLSLKLMP